jgi:hypothetical protein
MTERLITAITVRTDDEPETLHVGDDAWRLLMEDGWTPPAVPRP